MATFWDTSWANIAPERITQYIQDFDLTPDPLISKMLAHGAGTVCDAGCGCGIYALKLAASGFSVSGFDISAHATEIAAKLLQSKGFSADLRPASVLDTGYAADTFDCVVCRDVIDHISKEDGFAAIRELLRITRPGGLVFLTLDPLDEEYESQPHRLSPDGDYCFTRGKWEGMVFHPYSPSEIRQMIPSGVSVQIEDWDDGLLVCMEKSV